MYKMARKKKSALSYLTNILEDGLFVATAAYIHAKGQLISKCLLGVIVWTKKPTNFF